VFKKPRPTSAPGLEFKVQPDRRLPPGTARLAGCGQELVRRRHRRGAVATPAAALLAAKDSGTLACYGTASSTSTAMCIVQWSTLVL
jgi:hypothetical protein